MSLSEEFSKLRKSKTIIRRAIQENGAPLQTTEDLDTYSTYIDEYSNALVIDETNEAEYCKNSITQLVLTVTKIRDYAFFNNTSLKELVLDVDSVIELKPHAFKNTHFEKGTGIIYVPDDLYSQYMDSSWNKYTLKKTSEFIPNPDYLYPLETLNRYITINQLQNFTLEQIEKQ